jgi:tRNA A37 threonylcarbamoyladenosine biosynthesis protein TsaE
MSVEWTSELDETGVTRLAELLALKLRVGDIVALTGDLGAGKTTLARALIRAFQAQQSEVPSPTRVSHSRITISIVFRTSTKRASLGSRRRWNKAR